MGAGGGAGAAANICIGLASFIWGAAPPNPPGNEERENLDRVTTGKLFGTTFLLRTSRTDD
jgi:hypothetical protein